MNEAQSPTWRSAEIPFGTDFWVDIARRVLALDDLEDAVVIVPGDRHAAYLREALLLQLREGQRAIIRLPRMASISHGAGLTALGMPPSRPDTVRRIELFQALSNAPLVVSALSGGSASLWSASRRLLELCDALTLGGAAELLVPTADGSEGLEASVKSAYPNRAW